MIRRISFILLTTVLLQNAFAQVDKENEITVATSTPFTALTEEDRIQALISADRPRLQGIVSLDEKLKDAEIEREDAEYHSRRLEKLNRRMQRAQESLDKNTEHLTAVSELETIQQNITALEGKLSTETDPVKREQLETSLITKRDKLSKKEIRITTLEEKIAQLETKLADDQQAIEVHIVSRQAKLQQRLERAEAKQTELDEKISVLEAKRLSTENPTKITRIEKQLANKRLRKERLVDRIVRLQLKAEAVNQYIQIQEGDLAQNEG